MTKIKQNGGFVFEVLFADLLLLGLWEGAEVIGMVVFVANMMTVCLPNKSSNKTVQFILDALNHLSLNIINNANKLYPKRYAKAKKKGRKKGLGGSDD